MSSSASEQTCLHI